MFKIGDKVKTNDYYLNHGYSFIKSNPLKIGTITAIEQIDNHTIINVKTQNGKQRKLNQLFLTTI